MEQQVVTIIGGTGFVGRYVVKLLAAAGYTLRVVSRNPTAAGYLKTAGSVGQIVLVGGNLAEPASLIGKIEDSYAVVNLAGILYEAGKQQFAHVHAHGAEKLAQMAKAAGVQRFVQMSALGVDKAKTSDYARTKLLGEKAVLTAFPEATILRPSVIFGPEDHFYNQFASMAAMSPALPLIGGGVTRFQPVYVGDVAAAIRAALVRPDALGQTYELGGPNVYSFKDILEYVMTVTGNKRCLMPIPLGMASFMGSTSEFVHWTSQGFFKPAITRDQVRLLKSDNVVGAGAKGLSQLGVIPTAVEMVVPEYLGRFNKKAAA